MGLDMFLEKVKKIDNMTLKEIFNLGVYGEEIAYWRKANQIHKWFVENVQDDNDDCGSYVVTKEQLTELYETAKTVLDSSKLVPGMIKNGETYENGKWVPNMVEGKTIEDPSVAMKLLPTRSGFFFGSTDYDEWYLDDIELTVEKIGRVLKETDFDNEIVYYSSSW